MVPVPDVLNAWSQVCGDILGGDKSVENRISLESRI